MVFLESGLLGCGVGFVLMGHSPGSLKADCARKGGIRRSDFLNSEALPSPGLPGWRWVHDHPRAVVGAGVTLPMPFHYIPEKS